MPAWLTPLLVPLASVVTGIVGYMLARFQRTNAPDIIASDEAKKIQAEQEKLALDAQEALKTGNLDQVRKDVAN